MMLFNTDGKTLNTHLRTLHVLVFLLLQTHSCRGSSQPIVATLGDDITLPCHLVPAEDATDLTLEWTRPDLNPRFVHVWRSGQELVSKKHKSFEGRTSLFLDELKSGNISLKLSKVKIADQGRYRCFIPGLDRQSFVELVVGAACSPVLTLAGIDETTRGVMIDCRSEGWYPEPEVLWLDGEGNLLSAGPPETVRGPDDLYTVSSRVTVEKTHSNSFTCRVQQKNTNQTREAHIFISNDFFNVQSSSSPVITGLAVSLAVWIIMFILLLLFVVWKWRQIIISYGDNKKCDETKRSCRDQTEKGEKKNSSEINKTEDQCVTEEREREQLMTGETVEMEVLKGNEQKKSKHFKKKRSEQQLQEEQQRREEQQKEVQTLKEELETKKNEIETKGAELQQLHEEKKRNENELQSLKEELEKKNKELEKIQKTRSSFSFSLGPSQEDHQKKEVETLKKKLENQKKESDTKIKEFKEKEAEVQQLQDQIQRMETNLQTLMESNNMELERSRAAPVLSSSSVFKWQIVSRQKIQDEQQRRHEAENRVQTLEEELQTKNRELEDKQQAVNTQWKKTNEELKETKQQLKSKNEEINQLKREIWDQQQRRDGELKELTNKWQKLFQEEMTKREEAEKEVEKIEKQLQKETTKMNDAEKEVENPKKEMEDKSSSASQSSTTELPIVVEVNQKGNYIHLKNTVPKDQRLGGWTLEMEVNKKIITYTFLSSFKLKSRSTVTMSGPGCFQQYDLRWKDLTPWNSGDNLKFTLISNTCVRHQLN